MELCHSERSRSRSDLPRPKSGPAASAAGLSALTGSGCPHQVLRPARPLRVCPAKGPDPSRSSPHSASLRPPRNPNSGGQPNPLRAFWPSPAPAARIGSFGPLVRCASGQPKDPTPPEFASLRVLAAAAQSELRRPWPAESASCVLALAGSGCPHRVLRPARPLRVRPAKGPDPSGVRLATRPSGRSAIRTPAPAINFRSPKRPLAPEGRKENSPRGPHGQVFVHGAEGQRSAALG